MHEPYEITMALLNNMEDISRPLHDWHCTKCTSRRPNQCSYSHLFLIIISLKMTVNPQKFSFSPAFLLLS